MTTESLPKPTGRRIVLATFGSFGDLHPYIAIAQVLRARGHQPVIATSGIYRAKVEALGLGFHAVRPDQSDLEAVPDFMQKVMDQSRGPEFVVRDLFLGNLRKSYDDTAEAVKGADLVVGHPLTFTVRLLAEQQGIPWASSLLAPIGFFSAYDPPVLPPAPWLRHLRGLGPLFHKPLFRLMRWSLNPWGRPWHELRAELGLPPAGNPVFEAQHSPRLVLALFSKLLAQPQPDWPGHSLVTGFPFYDQDGDTNLPPDLARFLAAGPPPLVFTLGTSAVHTAGAFFVESIEVARILKRRAVLMVGKEANNVLPQPLPETVLACPYAPFSQLFPRAAAIVHQGGVGTTGQAMRSGRPMLVVPFAHDQPDNADRVRRMGIARVVPRTRYQARHVAAELRLLIDMPRYAYRAAKVGEMVREEDGAMVAALALEDLLTARARP
jgi:UDP:flavonoid glycosyltransferase YjiC (YdhE family)